MKAFLPTLLVALLSAGSIAHAQTAPSTGAEPSTQYVAPGGASAGAKGDGSKRAAFHEKMKNASPEEKKAMMEKMREYKAQKGGSGSGERAEKMKQRREEWKNASPEQREALKAKHKAEHEARLAQMSPEQRAKAEAKHAKRKEMMEAYKNASPEQKQAMREKMKERRAQNGGGRGSPITTQPVEPVAK